MSCFLAAGAAAAKLDAAARVRGRYGPSKLADELEAEECLWLQRLARGQGRPEVIAEVLVDLREAIAFVKGETE